MRYWIFIALALTTALAGAQIVVNEIMFNPPGTSEEEWIELYNYSDTDVFMDSTWLITDGEGEYHFEDVLLPADGFLTILVNRPDSGEIHLTPDIDATGHGIHLANAADDVVLLHATESDTMVIDSVTYSGSWAPDANNTGYSMERIHVFGDSNDPENWGASTVMWGTPDAPNSIAAVKEQAQLPADVRIAAYPNPFNSSCVVTAPAGSEVEVYDLRGNLIISLPPVSIGGTHQTITWHPDENTPSGIYLLKARTSTKTITARVMLVR